MPVITSVVLSTAAAYAQEKLRDHLADKGLDWTGDALWKRLKGLRAQDKLPDNQDLMKTVREAMLRATALPVEAAAVAEEGSNEGSADTYSVNIKRWIKEQLQLLKSPLPPDVQTPAHAHWDKLLAPDATRLPTAAEIKEAWIAEIKAGIKNEALPLRMEDYLRNGWIEDDGNRYDWFDITCYWFGQLLMEDKHEAARNAYQTQLLAQIAGDTARVDDALDAMCRLVPDAAFVAQRWDALEGKMDTMLSKQDVLQSTVEAGFAAMLAKLQDSVSKEEFEAARIELMQSKEVMAQQEAELAELKKSKVIKNPEVQAAMDERNFDKAAALKEDEIRDRIAQSADDFYQLAKINELQLKYADALHHYKLATDITPDNVQYLNSYGNICWQLAYLDKAVEAYTLALSEEVKNGKASSMYATLSNNLGTVWIDKGNPDKAIEYFEQALAANLKVYGVKHPLIAVNYNNLGGAWYTKGDIDRAIEYFEHALTIDLNVYGAEHPRIAVNYNNLGGAWSDKGNPDKAIGYYKQALRIDLKIYGVTHPNVAIRYNNLGKTWRDKGNLDKAIEYYQQALTINLKVYGAEHPQIALNYNNLGRAWHDKGKPDKAIEYFDHALAIILKAYGTEHPLIAVTYINLGGAWRTKGKPDKAIEYCGQALIINLKAYGAEHPLIAVNYNNLGGAWRDKGKPDKAIEYFKQALAIDLNVYGAEHPKVAIRYNNLGLEWRDKGDFDQYKFFSSKALAIFLKVYGPEHPSTMTVKENLGYIQQLKNNLPTSPDAIRK